MPSELDRQIDQLKRCECIKESEVRELCNKARDILIEESNIQYIYSPITVSYIFLITYFLRSAETSMASSMI